MAANLLQIQTTQEQAVLRAFREAIQSVRDQATIQEIVRLLEVGNVDGVITLLQLDAATFEPLEEAIRQAYRQGGLTGAEQIGTIPTDVGGIAARFNIRSLNAERWLANLSSRLITEVFDDQKQMVRERLTAGLRRGQAPRQTALDLIGRIDQRTRKRTGGFIGLTAKQAEWVDNARLELDELDSGYFTRKLRDKRFDSTVRKAIESGKPLTQDQKNRIITSLQNRTQQYRGQVISRNESLNALRAGQWESIQQAIAKGEVGEQDVTKIWDDTGDGKTRLAHLQMGQTYAEGIPVNQPFQAPDGSLLKYPGDTTLGASAEMTILCRCKARYRINFIGRAVRLEGF